MNPERANKKPISYQEFLETKILPDGSKVFSFSLLMQRRDNNTKENQSVKDRPATQAKRDGKRKGGRGKAEQNPVEKPVIAPNKNALNNEVLQEYFQERIESLTILKMFCRQGYFILEEFTDVNKISVKAECKESASIDDYDKFTKAK